MAETPSGATEVDANFSVDGIACDNERDVIETIIANRFGGIPDYPITDPPLQQAGAEFILIPESEASTGEGKI